MALISARSRSYSSCDLLQLQPVQLHHQPFVAVGNPLPLLGLFLRGFAGGLALAPQRLGSQRFFRRRLALEGLFLAGEDGLTLFDQGDAATPLLFDRVLGSLDIADQPEADLVPRHRAGEGLLQLPHLLVGGGDFRVHVGQRGGEHLRFDFLLAFGESGDLARRFVDGDAQVAVALRQQFDDRGRFGRFGVVELLGLGQLRPAAAGVPGRSCVARSPASRAAAASSTPRSAAQTFGSGFAPAWATMAAAAAPTTIRAAMAGWAAKNVMACLAIPIAVATPPMALPRCGHRRSDGHEAGRHASRPSPPGPVVLAPTRGRRPASPLGSAENRQHGGRRAEPPRTC